MCTSKVGFFIGDNMPKALEEQLKRQAKKKGLSKKRTGAYVYGTLRKTGWKPSREEHHYAGGSKTEFA